MFPDRIDPRVTYADQGFHMARPDLDDVPQVPLPSGYAVRTYRPGDELLWTRLQRAAEPFFEIADDLFEKEYGKLRDVLPQRMWFVEDAQGTVAASISAWWERPPTEPADPANRARIHWVVVHPDHQGRGLAKPMMTVAMNFMARHHAAAMLGTSSGRPWAVKVYLDFGFLPEAHELAKPDVLEAWQNLQSVIYHPALGAFLAAHAGFNDS
jgi:GNAT superfamily N-acetyltransferase